MYNLLKNVISSVQPIEEHEWNMVLPLFEFRELKRRELILKEGQICKTIDFIVGGSVRTYINVDGKEVSRQFFFENSFFNEMSSFLTQKPTLFNIEALVEILWWLTTLFRLSVTIIFRDAKQFIPHRFDHRKL